MGAFYWRAPTQAELAGTAYKVSDFEHNRPKGEVWDEHWDSLALFVQYSSQWRMGMGGPIGLDFNVFHHALDRKKVTEEEYDQYLEDLRIIESAALKEIMKMK